MLSELEAAAADALTHPPGGHGRHSPAPGALCANCQAVLQGPFCHACGQTADNHKRSILHLSWEVIEDLFHFDGRLRRTAPDLFLRPGRIAKDYIEGRLARHVPPFRTFLVSLLLFIFAAENLTHRITLANERQEAAHAAAMATPAGRAAEVASLRQSALAERQGALKEADNERDGDLKEADADRVKIEADHAAAIAKAEADYAEAMAEADRLLAGGPASEAERPAVLIKDSLDDKSGKKDQWFKNGLRKAMANPEYYLTVFFGWGHRLAVLLLPIVGLTLAVVYRNRPQYFIHDHMMVAMNILSFAFLSNALGFILPSAAMGPWLGLVAIWTPVNIFQTLRGAYGSSILGAALKTLVVWWTTVVSFTVLLVTLMVLALNWL